MKQGGFNQFRDPIFVDSLSQCIYFGRTWMSRSHCIGGDPVRLLALTLLVCGLVAAPSVAWADLLNGQQVYASFEHTPPYTQKGDGTFTVMAGAEITSGFGNGITIDLSDTTIAFSFSDDTFFGDGSGSFTFNGYVFSDSTDSIAPILSASLDGSSTLAPIVTFDENSVSVDFKGVSFTTTDSVVVHLSAIPEPSSLVLIAVGLLGLMRRRR